MIISNDWKIIDSKDVLPILGDSNEITRIQNLLPWSAHDTANLPVKKTKGSWQCFANMSKTKEKKGNSKNCIDDGDKLRIIDYENAFPEKALKYPNLSPLSLRSLISISNSTDQHYGVKQRAWKSPFSLLQVFVSIPPFYLRIDWLFVCLGNIVLPTWQLQFLFQTFLFLP